MRFTDLFIEKPVLSTVVSLMVLVLGARSVTSLPIQQYPSIQSSVITVSTFYTGAGPDAVAAYITTPLEGAIAQANGIDYMTSTSTPSTSTIQANLRLNWDADKALTEVNTLLSSVVNQLPKGSQTPVVTIQTGQSIDAMYFGFYSKALPSNKITDYLIRIIQPKLQAINGVQQAQVLGGRQFAMRIWLDPVKLAGYGISPAEVAQVLAANNVVSAAGRTDGQTFITYLSANTTLSSVEDFRKMAIKTTNNTIVRLGDVANVTLGAQDYNTSVIFDGQGAVYIGIQVAPTANLLSVIKDVKKEFAILRTELPEGLDGRIVYDSSQYVTSSIEEVNKSLLEAFAIVTLVVFMFLGSLRSLFIPVIAIPLSIIGTFFIMFLLGYSINLLTLLALVLAIGLVVDDAIIVVENVHRHLEEGKSPFQSAILSAQELTSPIIAITLVLIAVYLPIGFMTGLTGALFTEFAFTLASSVTVSAVIALTLTPMLCSKILRPVHNGTKEKFALYIDEKFEKLKSCYEKWLNHSLNNLSVVATFAVIILTSNYFLFITSNSELAPQEDQGIVLAQMSGAANNALALTEKYSEAVYQIFKSFPEYDHSFQINGAGGASSAPTLNSSINGMILKPWDQRHTTSNDIQPILQAKLSNIPGAQIAAFQLPSLPGGGGGLPIQFVIQTTKSFNELNNLIQEFLKQCYQSGIFMYLDADLKIDQEQATVELDKDRVSELGLNIQDISNSLSAALSEGYINYFDYMGRSYQVIPQMMRNNRLNDSDLMNYYIMTSKGQSIALSSVAKIQRTVIPESLNHFQQLNSSTVSAIAFPGISMGQALSTMQAIASNMLPEGYTIDYAGQSRQFVTEGSALIITFFFALIVIFLTLSAQFNSFRDPLIILISVPMSICGAMIFICIGIGGATLNIYTEVGLVTLIGLISKHGILIVQFANDLQRAGSDKRTAIAAAATVRLRPILMTTAAMVLGVIPLILASGAGAVSRFNIGLVIATGISIGTLFTLFVVPAMYMLLADNMSASTAENGLQPNQV